MTGVLLPYLKHNNFTCPAVMLRPCIPANIREKQLAAFNRSATDTAHQAAIAAAICYIKEHFMQELGIAEIAASVYMSTYHFCRIFKKQTTYAPYQYLLQVRLERAAFLLGNSGKPVTDICYLCGFKRASHFSAMFTKKYHISPTAFRIRAQLRKDPR